MNKKGIKKYQWGTFSASGSTTPQMVNPGNSALKQINTAQTTETSTPSIADPNAKSMAGMKQFTNKGIQGPSFMDKAGDFMGNYGGAITQAAGTLMPLLMKKTDPNAKPYKNGTNMIKYQGGTQGAKAKRNMQHIMEQNMAQNAMNFILNANVANDKRNAELNSRVAPKKLESKKANVKTDSLKTNKPNLIKYQEGNEFLQSGKGMKNFLNTMEENNTRLSNASVKKEPVEKFDMSSIADIMPDIPQRFPKGSKAPDDTQVGPLRKEMADLLRAYNKKENAAGRLGYIDMEEADKMYEQNEAMMGNKINRVSGKIETLSPKMASLKFSKEPSMTPKLNMVPVKEQSKAERKAENKRLEGMAKAPISYTDNAFVGPQNFVGPSNMAGPSNQELQLGRTKEDAESARKTYEARLAGESARSAYEAKQKGTPMTDALIKRSMSSQAFKETMSPYKSFKDMTPAQQKQYRAGIASGKKFSVEGIGEYAASKEKQEQSTKMASKSTGAKPLIKMKESTVLPGLKSGRPIYTFDTVVEDNQATKQKETSVPKTQERAKQETAQKPMSNDFFEKLTGVAKNLNTQAVKQKQNENLNRFKKSGQLKGLQESLEYMKNVAGGRYKTPQAPRADLGKKGVKTYLERVTSKQTERDPRAEYDYQKLAPWGKVKSEGAIDYLSTLFASPQKTTNYLLTGRYENPIDTYNLAKSKDDRIKGNWKLAGDIATDPMMYPEAFYGAGKMVGKGAVKAGRYIGQALQKIPYAKLGKMLEKFGGKVLSEKGRLGQALLHYNEDSKEREGREKNRPSFEMK